MSESSPPPDPLRDRLDRRELLARAAMGAGAFSLVALAGCMDAERRKRLAIARPGESHRVLTDAEWATLSAAQEPGVLAVYVSRAGAAPRATLRIPLPAGVTVDAQPFAPPQ